MDGKEVKAQKFIWTSPSCFHSYFDDNHQLHVILILIVMRLWPSKRKSEEPRDTPTEKKPRVGDQIGGGEVEKPQDDDDGPCQLISACKIT